MKTLLAILCFAFIPMSCSLAGTKVFQYGDFGPQAATYKFLGHGWFQWDAHGDESRKIDSRIKVVVYWKEDLKNIQKQFPVDQKKMQDYRYLELKKAIKHLKKLIPDLEALNLKTEKLKLTLKSLTKIQSTSENSPE